MSDSFGKRIKTSMPYILFLLACFAVSALLALPVLAAEGGSIQIEYHARLDTNENYALSDAPFALYYAGVWNDGTWTLSDAFSGSKVSLKGQDASERNQQAEALYAYAKAQKLEALTGKTDASGKLRFEGLKNGLYLAVQTETLVKDKKRFWSAPFLVSIPGVEDGQQISNVTVSPKNEWENVKPDNGGGSHGGGGGGNSGGGSNPGGGGSQTTQPGGPGVETQSTESQSGETTGGGTSQAETSEQPGTTESGTSETTTGSDQTEKTGHSAKTGDVTSIGLWSALLVFSAGMILFLCRRKRDDKDGTS